MINRLVKVGVPWNQQGFGQGRQKFDPVQFVFVYVIVHYHSQFSEKCENLQIAENKAIKEPWTIYHGSTMVLPRTMDLSAQSHLKSTLT